jgi:D-proline reductase (dithiol) PrdB
VSLVARYLEEHGLPTVLFSNARDITMSANVPRTVFTNYPLGNPVGRPHGVDDQHATLRAGLQLLETAKAPTIIERDSVWSDSREWMRLIFTEEQPFLTDEAEQRRQADLRTARAQKS